MSLTNRQKRLFIPYLFHLSLKNIVIFAKPYASYLLSSFWSVFLKCWFQRRVPSGKPTLIIPPPPFFFLPRHVHKQQYQRRVLLYDCFCWVSQLRETTRGATVKPRNNYRFFSSPPNTLDSFDFPHSIQSVTVKYCNSWWKCLASHWPTLRCYLSFRWKAYSF